MGDQEYDICPDCEGLGTQDDGGPCPTCDGIGGEKIN